MLVVTEECARIQEGSVLLFRFLDIAEEFDLDRAERVLAQRTPSVRRVTLRKESSAGLALDTVPVELDLGARTVELDGGAPIEVSARIRLFRFGVVSIVLEAPIAAGTSIAELVPLAARTWESARVDEVARGIASELAAELAEIAGEPLTPSPLIERYAVVFVRAIDGDPLSAPEPLARLLLGENDPRPLAASVPDDLMKHRFRYFADDLTIVHATSGLVVEPDGGRDVVLALELAYSQLLELRVYDELIDRQLDRAYDDVERASGAGFWLFGRAQDRASRRAQRHIIELAELADRAQNAVKVASDLYLARVYLAALERNHATVWRESVTGKLRLFAQVYEVLKEEAHAQRAFAVEVVIVVLIAFEIVMALIER